MQDTVATVETTALITTKFCSSIKQVLPRATVDEVNYPYDCLDLKLFMFPVCLGFAM